MLSTTGAALSFSLYEELKNQQEKIQENYAHNRRSTHVKI
jgi:hypothetical protein